MKRAMPRRAGYSFGSVDIVYLDRASSPPENERYLIFEWARTGSGFRIEQERLGMRYVVSPDKHVFWLGEAPHVARRLQLVRVYYRGAPTFGDKPSGASDTSHPDRVIVQPKL